MRKSLLLIFGLVVFILCVGAAPTMKLGAWIPTVNSYTKHVDVQSGSATFGTTVPSSTVTGTNQIAVGNQQYGGLGSVIRQGASTKTILSTGNETMSWNEGTTTRDWAQYTSEIGVP